MRYRRLIVASVLVTVTLAAVAGVAVAHAAPGAQLPTHWNAAGEADRFAGASVALFMPAVLAAIVSLVFAVIPRVEPMQHRLERSAPLLATAWAGSLGMMAVIEAVVAAPVFGIALPPTLPLAAGGLLLMAIGNMLPKSRPGFFIGIRTPWALIDEDNWIATHRFGAKTTVAAGAAIAAVAVLPLAPAVRAAVTVAALIAAVVPPVVYSFLHWQRRVRA